MSKVICGCDVSSGSWALEGWGLAEGIQSSPRSEWGLWRVGQVNDPKCNPENLLHSKRASEVGTMKRVSSWAEEDSVSLGRKSPRGLSLLPVMVTPGLPANIHPSAKPGTGGLTRCGLEPSGEAGATSRESERAL